MSLLVESCILQNFCFLCSFLKYLVMHEILLNSFMEKAFNTVCVWWKMYRKMAWAVNLPAFAHWHYSLNCCSSFFFFYKFVPQQASFWFLLTPSAKRKKNYQARQKFRCLSCMWMTSAASRQGYCVCSLAQ